MNYRYLALAALLLSGCGGSPEKQMEKAVSYHEAGQLTEATEAYAAVLKKEPEHLGALFNIGLIAQSQGNWEKALETYNQAHALAPEDPGVLMERAYVYLETGKLEQAAADASAALALDPESVDLLRLKGEVALAQGQTREAIQQISEAIWEDPDYPELYSVRADAWEQLGEEEMAAVDRYLQELTLSLEEDELSARVQRAEWFALLEQVDLAEYDLDWVLAADANYGPALLLQTDMLLNKGEQGEALTQLKALRDHPDQHVAALALTREAELLREAGGAAQALATLDQVEALKSHPRVMSLKAWYLAVFPEDSLRNDSKAMELAEAAVQASSGDDELLLRAYAAALAANGRFEEAIEVQQQVLGLTSDPEDPMHEQALKSYLEQRPYRITP